MDRKGRSLESSSFGDDLSDFRGEALPYRYGIAYVDLSINKCKSAIKRRTFEMKEMIMRCKDEGGRVCREEQKSRELLVTVVGGLFFFL